MNNFCVVKKCCLICRHGIIEDIIKDIDGNVVTISCQCDKNLSKDGGSPCMDITDNCEYFMISKRVI